MAQFNTRASATSVSVILAVLDAEKQHKCVCVSQLKVTYNFDNDILVCLFQNDCYRFLKS